ncbi:CAMK family protein kinase [Elysia marginata]|uniref:CAMK family protein kinase n=1 Tax=Elysia marginata TaxID=1093978 RepID=A0AAV4FTZ2_9GAST|nr:CAMK family protein kinase [Elysia marginata]
MDALQDTGILLKLQADYFDFFDFHIAKVLGEGRSGDVVLAMSNSYSDITRAVKRISLKPEDLKRRNLTHEIVMKRFLNEVKIARVLEHPNVIRSTNGIVCPNYLAIAMEYCSNGTLANHLKQINRELIDRFFTGLVSAVEYVHSRRIVHGDIRPQNIFVTALFEPVLGDFGMSFTVPESTQYIKTAEATMLNLAPELMNKAESVDPFKCDCYAVGLVLNCMVQRRRPDYHSDDKKRSSTTTCTSTATIDDKHKFLLLMLLCKNPFKRFSMSEVQRTLSEFTQERYTRELSGLLAKKRCLGNIGNSADSSKQAK